MFLQLFYDVCKSYSYLVCAVVADKKESARSWALLRAQQESSTRTNIGPVVVSQMNRVRRTPCDTVVLRYTDIVSSTNLQQYTFWVEVVSEYIGGMCIVVCTHCI